MKKIFCLFLLTFLLGACYTKTVPDRSPEDEDKVLFPTEAQTTEGDFEYLLYSKKDSYDEHTNPEIYAELTYIGEQDSINIYHAASPFHFPMKERNRGLAIDYAMNEPLIRTTLLKDEPLREKYSFAGGYSDNDDKKYIDFVQDLIDNGFPEGDYVIDGFVDFYIEDPSEATNHEKFNLKASIGFIVKKAE